MISKMIKNKKEGADFRDPDQTFFPQSVSSAQLLSDPCAEVHQVMSGRDLLAA